MKRVSSTVPILVTKSRPGFAEQPLTVSIVLFGKTRRVTASSDVDGPRCPTPNKNRRQTTSKVSHHETAAQNSLESSIAHAQRTPMTQCGYDAPESSCQHG